jgi:DNA methylase
MPLKLAVKCIKAATSQKGVCSACGVPWERVVKRKVMVIDRSERTHERGQTRASGTMLEAPLSETTGWRPTCACNAAIIPATVFDPFAGAGTTLVAADALGRSGIGIELSPKYLALAERRLARPHARHVTPKAEHHPLFDAILSPAEAQGAGEAEPARPVPRGDHLEPRPLG